MNSQIKQVEKDSGRRRSSIMLIWACFFLYVFAMGSKNIYTAEIVAIQGVFNKTKAEVSLAMTWFFIMYAIMQIVLAVIMKKINLKNYLSVTATISAVLTVLIAFMPSIEALYVVCAINGVVQAGIYSGCMAVLSKYLSKDMLAFGNKIMSLGLAFYGAIAYGIPAIFVSLGSWNLSFIVVGILFLGPIAFFFYAVNKMKSYPKIVVKNEEVVIANQNGKTLFELNNKKSVGNFYILMMWITLVSNCTLYAVLNWVPDMLHGVFGMPQGYSILVTLLAPVAQALGPLVVIGLCEKYENIIKVSFYSALASLVVIVALMFCYKVNIVLSIVIILLYIATGQGARCVFGGIIAFKMRSKISSGAYLATTNALASIAAGIMPPIAGLIIDSCSGTLGYGRLYLVVSIINGLLILTLLGMLVFMKSKSKKLS